MAVPMATRVRGCGLQVAGDEATIRMSGWGQKRKGSRRADVFRFTPGSRRSNGHSLRARLGHIQTSGKQKPRRWPGLLHRELRNQVGPQADSCTATCAYPKVTGINDAIVVFDGTNQLYASNLSIVGTIDRVTGDVDATQSMTDAKTGKTISSTRYLLKCRPAQRLF